MARPSFGLTTSYHVQNKIKTQRFGDKIGVFHQEKEKKIHQPS
jgi:hypothetical protein